MPKSRLEPGISEIPDELLVEKSAIEDVNAHGCQSYAVTPGNGVGLVGLFGKMAYPVVPVHGHDAKFPGLGQINFQTAHRHIGAHLDVPGDHGAIIHFVDVVAGQDKDIVRVMSTDDVQILNGSSAVPAYQEVSVTRC